jgi:hypothetical protein
MDTLTDILIELIYKMGMAINSNELRVKAKSL